MKKRYTGFWHTKPVSWVENMAVSLSSYIWRKKYADKEGRIGLKIN